MVSIADVLLGGNLLRTGGGETGPTAGQYGTFGEFQAAGMIRLCATLALLAKHRPIRKIVDLGCGRGWALTLFALVR